MNRDDDSILSSLLHQLDLDSALFHLQRIGFRIKPNPCNKPPHHHLCRHTKGDAEEELLIKLDDRNHFQIKHAYEGKMVTHPDTIATWEEWILFVTPLMAKRRREERPDCKEEQKEEEDANVKRLKCAEQ